MGVQRESGIEAVGPFAMARGAAALLLLAAAASAQRRRAQTTSGGAIFAFGRNNYGQLGLGSSSNALEPAELAALGTDNSVVSSGFYVVHVLKLSGAVHEENLGLAK